LSTRLTVDQSSSSLECQQHLTVIFIYNATNR